MRTASRKKASLKRPKRPATRTRRSRTVVGITRKELAKRLPCNPRSISRWLEDGLPVLDRGRGGQAARFDERAVRAWLASRTSSTGSGVAGANIERRRRDLAAALEAEQRIATRARTLVHVNDIERVWSAQVSAVRSRFLAMPAALADPLHRAAVTDGPAAVEGVLQRAIDQALTELSTNGGAIAG